jgi:hypothetical protein
MSATKKTVDTTDVKLSAKPGVADTEGMTEDNLSPATDVAPSGALIEPEIVERIDTSHPAVDDRPRAGQPRVANQIDFNDPTLDDAEAVQRNLGGGAPATEKPAK